MIFFGIADVFILVAGGIGMGSILICFEIFICRKAKRRERQQMLAIHYARLWRAKVANTKRKRLMTGQNNETSTKSPKSFDKKKEKPSRRSGRLAADSNLRNLRNGDIEKLSIPDLKSLKFQELPDSKQNLQKVQSLKFVTPIQYNREPYQFVPVKQVLSSFHSTAKRRRSPSAESSLSSVPETDKKFFNDFSCSADKLDNQPPPPRYESMTVELWKLHRRPIQVDSEVWLGEEAEEGGFDEYSAYRPRTRIMRAGRRKGHEIEKASVGDPKSSRL